MFRKMDLLPAVALRWNEWKFRLPDWKIVIDLTELRYKTELENGEGLFFLFFFFFSFTCSILIVPSRIRKRMETDIRDVLCEHFDQVWRKSINDERLIRLIICSLFLSHFSFEMWGRWSSWRFSELINKDDFCNCVFNKKVCNKIINLSYRLFFKIFWFLFAFHIYIYESILHSYHKATCRLGSQTCAANVLTPWRQIGSVTRQAFPIPIKVCKRVKDVSYQDVKYPYLL